MYTELPKLIKFEIPEEASKKVEEAYTKYIEENSTNEIMNEEEYNLQVFKLGLLAKELELKEEKRNKLRKEASVIDHEIIRINEEMVSIMDLIKF